MADTKIEWADKVWNPIAGCTKCSPGCLNCYAERMAWRLARMYRKYPVDTQLKKYHTVMRSGSARWNNKIYCDYSILDKPRHWREPRRIFVCSMSDLFHPEVPFEFIDKVFDAMFGAHWHTYLILTKRIEQMAKYIYYFKKKWEETPLPSPHWSDAPNQRIHLGVSISNQDEMWKAKVLADIPAAVKYISFEPLLEDIIDIPVEVMNKIDGCIIGCESGSKRREFDIRWALGIVADFHHFNKTVFVKQININGKVVKMPKDYPQEYPERR